jgi:hypothetical protein
MKLLYLTLLITLSASCSAGTADNGKCSITTKSLNLTTPKSANIVNSFWQDDEDGEETIKRLTINYKDGSIAMIEHKYCSMYNFEVAYYVKDKGSVKTTDAISETLNSLFAYAALTDNSQKSAIQAMTQRLKEKKFNPDNSVSTGYDQSNESNQKSEYSISYLPIEDSSLHEAALFVYMGIGGMH